MNKKKSMLGAVSVELLIGVAVWLALVIVKALGFLPGVNWITVLLGMLWLPIALILLLYMIVGAADIIRWLREVAYRIHTVRTLRDAMHGMTLNTIGPIYGVERHPGEPNRYYEQRILFTAAKGKKLHLKRTTEEGPQPATGKALDKIAQKYGLQRYKNETDKHLQGRVREAVMKRPDEKLEGGKA